jgi:hypothetical protein
VCLKEEDRLACVVAVVAKEAAIAPLHTQKSPPGAFRKPNNFVSLVLIRVKFSEWIRRGGARRSLQWPGLSVRRRDLWTYQGDGRRDAQFCITL